MASRAFVIAVLITTYIAFVSLDVYLIKSVYMVDEAPKAPKLEKIQPPPLLSLNNTTTLTPTPIDCGVRNNEPHDSDLATFIGKAIHMIPASKTQAPMCIMEVGTAAGAGTTIKLFSALYDQCVGGGREFMLHSYEGDPALAATAKERWRAHSHNVRVTCQLVMHVEFMQRFVIRNIEGPESDDFPGRGFYTRLYLGTPDRVSRGEFCGFFPSPPSCSPDLVLIDGTRFATAGIVATVLNLTRPETVFVVEDDFWDIPAPGSERRILERHWRLVDVEAAHPRGEMWPWLMFRVGGEVV